MSGTPHSLTVLLVDDESLVRWAISRTLARAGHVVLEAADAASALDTLRHAVASPDVVLLDQRLPDARGFDLLSKIRAVSPASAIVMMTADGTPDDEAAAIRMGVSAVMQKPFDMRDVEPALLRARATQQHRLVQE